MGRRILYIQYTNPNAYPPLEHSSQLLADDGWEIVFLGIRKHGDPALDWPMLPGIRAHTLSPSSPGWRRKLHYARYALWVIAWFIRWRPAWVYVSDALSSPIGLALSFWPGVNIVYHEHDAPQVDARGMVRRIVLRIRAWLAGRATARVLPNERRAEQFKREVSARRPIFSVWNCPSRDEVGPGRDVGDSPGLEVVYVGSVVPVRLPTTVLEALALLPEVARLRVIGYETSGHTGYICELQRLAAKLSLTQRTEFMGGIPHPKLLSKLHETDVGLVLMPSHFDDGHCQWMPGASNKPFDYLARGLAVLVTDDPGWRKLIVDAGYGLACDPTDPRSLAAALRQFLERPAEMREMGERGRQRVLAEWNYETQFAPVRDLINANRDSRPRTI
jgi:glycosyltransferase involved in cell wall biosynthesis